MGPLDLLKLLPEEGKDSRLLVGYDTSDDAGVVRLNDEQALVSTVDLITPVADDPYVFGRIAAANSMSDIYAMGCVPLAALNVCCFPEVGPAQEALARILEGGQERILAAGALVLGGHTVRDPELKYGLSVSGVIHPGRIVRNHTLREGDLLVLTKPLGTGLLLSAEGKGELDPEHLRVAQEVMIRLNEQPSRLMLEHGVHAATDVTGYGLAGHLVEMLGPGGFAVEVHLNRLPVYAGAEEAAERYGLSGPMRRNLAAAEGVLPVNDLELKWQVLLGDPQTSGGLLIALPESGAGRLVEELNKLDQAEAAVIGRVLAPAEKSRFEK